MGSQKETKITTVSINVENRYGGIYISSDDVPGLWLWGEDSEEVFNDVIPAIQELYRLNVGKDVDVRAIEKSRAERLSGVEKMPNRFDIYDRAQSQRIS